MRDVTDGRTLTTESEHEAAPHARDEAAERDPDALEHGADMMYAHLERTGAPVQRKPAATPGLDNLHARLCTPTTARERGVQMLDAHLARGGTVVQRTSDDEHDEDGDELEDEANEVEDQADEQDGEHVHEIAAAGVAGPGQALPHAERIQAAFGPHDVSAVQAHVGGAAGEAAEAIGAEAYATGNSVAFKEQPDLHTAAHEAAHVVQQRQGVQLKGGVGEAGDAYERQADAAADAVVAGRSAAPILGMSARGSSRSDDVQAKASKKKGKSKGGKAKTKAPNATAMLADYERAYSAIRKAMSSLAAMPDGTGEEAARSLLNLFEDANDLKKRIEAAPMTARQRVVFEETQWVMGKLYAEAAPVMKRHGVGIKTGVAILDQGYLCERDPNGDGCFLDDNGRNRLQHALLTGVGSSLANFRSAIRNARFEKKLKQRSRWGFFAEVLFYAATGPLIGLAAKGVRAAKASVKSAKDIDMLDIMRGASEPQVNRFVKGVASLNEDAVTGLLQTASRGLRAEFKSKAAAPDKDSQDSFLSILEEQLKTIHDGTVLDAPASLNDVQLVALVISYLDKDIHSIASYEAKVAEMFQRFDDQELDQIGRKHEDGGRTRAVMLRAYGSYRPAVLEEHGTDYVDYGDSLGLKTEPVRGAGVNVLLSLVDDDLTPFLPELEGGGLETIDVTDDMSRLPFTFPALGSLVRGHVKTHFQNWVAKAKRDSENVKPIGSASGNVK